MANTLWFDEANYRTAMKKIGVRDGDKKVYHRKYEWTWVKEHDFCRLTKRWQSKAITLMEWSEKINFRYEFLEASDWLFFEMSKIENTGESFTEQERAALWLEQKHNLVDAANTFLRLFNVTVIKDMTFGYKKSYQKRIDNLRTYFLPYLKESILQALKLDLGVDMSLIGTDCSFLEDCGYPRVYVK